MRIRARLALRCIVAAGIILALASCGRFSGSAPSSRTPVILISIDTLRSDHLPAYGYTRVSTPNIDALRKDAILYERAYSHTPLTLPSHTSVMTGLLPSENGVRDNVGFVLDAKTPTLAELLKKNGYATGAAISAFVLRRGSGISRGFDLYDDDVEPIGDSAVIGRVQRDGRDTLRVAEKWLDTTGDKPLFLFVHFYEPHTPYEPPEPFRSTYRNDLYDGEIAYTDQLIGEFISDLKSRGLYDKSMIILMSDHGEGLNDHGEEEHGIFLYREAIQVPLMVKLPKSSDAGASVKAPVQLIDIFPTILTQTATPLPKEQSEAVSLLAELKGDVKPRPVYSETYYPRFHFGWSDLHSLVDGDHQYIRAPIPELYNLATDPAEKKNIVGEDRRATVRLRTAIEPFVKKASAPAQVDPEDAAKLAALGYVGSSVSVGENEVLPDPKTTIDVFRQIRVAYTYFRNEKLDQSLELTNKLLADNERIVDLWDLKSKILSKLGRNDEAIEAARSGLKQQPNAVALLMAVANLSIMTGKLDQAEQHADLLLKIEPPRAHEIKARIYAQRNDYANAKKEAELSLQNSPDPADGLMTLGLIAKQQGDLNAALRYMDDAVAKLATHRNKRVPNLNFYRGDILARLGRTRDAEAAFRREIELYPTQPDAYGSLILLLSTEGRVEEATQLVFQLIKVAPVPPSYVTVSETLQSIGDSRGAQYWIVQGLRKFPNDRSLRDMARALGRPTAAAG